MRAAGQSQGSGLVVDRSITNSYEGETCFEPVCGCFLLSLLKVVWVRFFHSYNMPVCGIAKRRWTSSRCADCRRFIFLRAIPMIVSDISASRWLC